MAVVEWERLTYLDLASLNKEKTVIIIPLGSLEVHGPHMPLGTDAFIAYRVAVEAAEKSPPAVVLPPLFYTYVPENRHFPGAVSLSGSTFLKILEEVCDEIYRNGFKRILILNAHGGNRRPLSFFVREMQEKGKPYLLYAWVEPWKAIQDVIEKIRETEPIEHACEIETSMGLHLFPELCKLERVKGPAKLGVEKVVNDIQTMVDWVSYAIEGYVGDPRAATKDKGKVIFEEWVRKVADLLEKIRGDNLYEKILMDFYSKAGY
ncbi:MAG: creatininase family protein [Thermofilaceae archaeon]